MRTRCLKNSFSWAGALLAGTLVFSGIVKAGIAADYTFTNFDFPDQTYSFAGLNNQGQVVGTVGGGGASQGACTLGSGSAVFLLSGDGVYTMLPYPDLEPGSDWGTDIKGMCAKAINDSGVVVGTFVSDAVTQGFKYSNGVYDMIAAAGTNEPTWVQGINDSGQVVGYYWSSTLVGGNTHEPGFIESGGVYTILDGPTPTTYYDFVGGINDEGQVVGLYEDDENSSGLGYIRSSDGIYQTPFPGVGEQGHDGLMTAWPIGINDSGQVLAFFRDGCITRVYSDGQYTPIIHPDALRSYSFGTCSQGINDQGQVVGNYYDGTEWHGFIATPKPQTTTALTASSDTPVYGTSVTLTATVAGTDTGAPPTGTVSFNDGAADLGPGVLEDGTATFATSSLELGSHTLTAAYGGDATHASSTSPGLTVTVTLEKADQATLTVVATPEVIPSGSSSALSTTGGSGTGAVSYAIVASLGATCTISDATLTANGNGTCDVAATKAADASYNATTSAAIKVTVTVAPTLTVTKSGDGTVTGPGIDCGDVCTASYVSGTLVTLTATPASGYAFSGWAGACTGPGVCTLTMDAAKSVNATFTVLRNLTVTTSGDGKVTGPGIDCGSDCTESYPTGTVVALTASPAAGYIFAKWSGACTGTDACSVTMSAAKSVKATFKAIPQYNLTVRTSGSGTVVSDPAGIDCGTDCGEAYPSGTPVTLTATPASNYVFSGWTGACTETGGGCTVTMDAAKSVKATFKAIPRYNLTVRTSGSGTVTSEPAGLTCVTDCGEAYLSGTLVTLTATPDSGYVFSGWTGACTGAGACTLTMDAAKSVKAIFKAIPKYNLTVRTSGSGTVTSEPAGITCGTDCGEAYPSGTPVTLTAIPASNYVFSGWTGACTGIGGCTVTMDARKSVKATFAR